MPFALVAALASNVPVVASKLPAMMELSQFVEVHGFPTPLTLLQSEASTDLSKTVVRRLWATARVSCLAASIRALLSPRPCNWLRCSSRVPSIPSANRDAYDMPDGQKESAHRLTDIDIEEVFSKTTQPAASPVTVAVRLPDSSVSPA